MAKLQMNFIVISVPEICFIICQSLYLTYYEPPEHMQIDQHTITVGYFRNQLE